MSDETMYPEDAEEYVTIEIPRWMLKQMRGQARWDMSHGRTKGARDDAKRMYELLDFYWEQATDNS